MVHEKIREIMKNLGVTQQQLADKSGMSLGQINRILQGVSPNMASLQKMAAALDVDVSEFFERDEKSAISLLAAKTIDSLPEDIVKALADRAKQEYLLVGLRASDSELTPEEIELILKTHAELKKQISRK